MATYQSVSSGLVEGGDRRAVHARPAGLARLPEAVDSGLEETSFRTAFSNALADSEAFAAVEAARRNDAGSAERRRLDLLHDLMLRHQVPASLRERIVELEASVGSRFVRHRGVVRGAEVDDNEIKRILRESDDPRERREAWGASKTVGAAVADDVRQLARMRNEAARTLGHRDWFALSLETDEMDEGKLAATLAEADRATAEPFARWKSALDEKLAARFGCTTSELRPWHYADPFFQDPPAEGSVELDHLFRGRDLLELSRRTFGGLGFDVDGILERSDLFPRADKNQHGFCIDIDREGDVRILANVVDDRSWMETMLHELGHGVYDLGFDGELPWLLRDTHLVTTEATAILFGGLSGDREWLARILELEPRDAAALAGPLRAARVAELLVFTRWVLVMNGFERGLYADPEADLDALWWELVSRYQLVTPRTGGARRTGPRRSTSRSHLSTTTRISTDRSSPRSSAPRSTPTQAASSSGRPRATSSGSGSSRRGCRSAGTSSSSARPGGRFRSLRSRARSLPPEQRRAGLRTGTSGIRGSGAAPARPGPGARDGSDGGRRARRARRARVAGSSGGCVRPGA